VVIGVVLVLDDVLLVELDDDAARFALVVFALDGCWA
jgi:hypothetical protein